MGNLLDFQYEISNVGQVVFSIEKQELNPDLQFETVEGSEEEFNSLTYDNKDMRDYIKSHSQQLTDNGNFIKGELKGNKVILSVLKLR